MDEEPRLEASGTQDEVLAAIDASIAATPDGLLVPAKQFVRAQLAALPAGSMGIGIRILSNTDDVGGWTIMAVYAIYPNIDLPTQAQRS